MILNFHNAIMTKDNRNKLILADGVRSMEHVLVIDGEMSILESVKQALEKNYRVSLFSSENQVMEYLQLYRPDLILISAKLPGTKDFEVFERIKRCSYIREIPVIVITNQGDSASQKKAIMLGADDFVTKPLDAEVLRNRLKIQMELRFYRNDKSYTERFQDAISVSFAELVEFRDETTGGHLKNTTVYFRILLEAVMRQEKYKDAIEPEDVKDILRSVPLHDIGKIGINDDILRKSSVLNDNEYESMKKHTMLGKQAFEKIITQTGETRWLTLAMNMAYCHHEHWDGTGYPNGLRGEEIPLYVRVLTIADVYDALTSWRSYKEPYSHEKAMEIILKGKGTLFDPNLVDLFIEINEHFKQALLNKKQSAGNCEAF